MGKRAADDVLSASAAGGQLILESGSSNSSPPRACASCASPNAKPSPRLPSLGGADSQASLQTYSLYTNPAQQGDARINVFAFPHAGGTIHSFSSWVEPLQDIGVRLIAATYSSSASSMKQIAD